MFKFSKFSLLINILLLKTICSPINCSSFTEEIEKREEIKQHEYYQAYLLSNERDLPYYVYSLSLTNPLASTWFLLNSDIHGLINYPRIEVEKDLSLISPKILNHYENLRKKTVENLSQFFSFATMNDPEYLKDFFLDSVRNEHGIQTLLEIMEKTFYNCHEALYSNNVLDKIEHAKIVASGNKAQLEFFENIFECLYQSKRINEKEYTFAKNYLEKSKAYKQQQINIYLAINR